MDDVGPVGWRIWTNDLVGRERRAIRQHSHEVHEVVWGATGTRTVEIGPDTWIIPPTIGVLIPAGTPHGGTVAAGAAYRCTLIDPALADPGVVEPVAIAITPAWREVILRLRDEQLPETRRRRIEDAAIDLTEVVDTPSIILPLPRDPRLREIAEQLIVNPAAADDLVSWGRHAGASARTITRRFTAETGLTFAEWRTHARIRAALVHLAAGTSVAHVARLVGYQTTGAFVKAFRLTTGQAPGAFAKGTSPYAMHLDHTDNDVPRRCTHELAPA
ncbi:helix-turn-helix domain-containing protein [Desertimonas flava]|uniref:helix-turn-helix domain-containing protein n=1 Tax=Desertimonas flava TaxID=2064846 RepID=UPI0013C4F5C2|nr:AraC family transcriptional regulator [Desertimonas flava]